MLDKPIEKLLLIPDIRNKSGLLTCLFSNCKCAVRYSFQLRASGLCLDEDVAGFFSYLC